MKPERINNIFQSIVTRHNDLPPLLFRRYVLNDMCAVMRGLLEKESLLESVIVSIKDKTIIFNIVEDYLWVNLLPYLYKDLRETQETYVVYFVEDNSLYLEGAIEFINLYEQESDILGFDTKIYESQSLGIYFPKENEYIGIDDIEEE